jgi:uncharacterized protein VirK/YbjX
MTKNKTQKQLIETLTITHQQPQTAYIAVLNGCKTQEETEQVKKIAKKYNIKI